MYKSIGMILEENNLEAMSEHIRIRTVGYRREVVIEEIIGMKIMREVGVGLEKGHIKVI